MISRKLSKSVIDALPSPPKDVIWWDASLKGFGVKVTPAGRKVFLVQYRPVGDRRNPRKYTIGEYGAVTPHQARTEAQRILAERAAGRDPQVEKQIRKRRIATDGVAELVADFLERHAAQNRTAGETMRILNREVLPRWGSRTVGEIRKREVIELLDAIRERGSPIMANRVLAAVRKFFNWCISRSVIEISPCAGVTAPTKERSRHRVLDDPELAAVFRAAMQYAFPYGSIIQLLAMTGQRREEVGRLGWIHLNLEQRIWTIPAEHAKNEKSHVVHLSERAAALIEASPRLGQLVFSSDGQTVFQGYSKSKQRLDQMSGVRDWTLHDLRRTVVSGMARLGVAPHVADKILNHQSGAISGVAAVYQRHEFLAERKDALNLWAAHIAKLIS